jgi:hypothetical protein
MILLPAVVFYGIATVLVASFSFGNYGKERMRAYVVSHKWYFRTVAIIMILSELVLLSVVIAGPRG